MEQHGGFTQLFEWWEVNNLILRTYQGGLDSSPLEALPFFLLSKD